VPNGRSFLPNPFLHHRRRTKCHSRDSLTRFSVPLHLRPILTGCGQGRVRDRSSLTSPVLWHRSRHEPAPAPSPGTAPSSGSRHGRGAAGSAPAPRPPCGTVNGMVRRFQPASAGLYKRWTEEVFPCKYARSALISARRCSTWLA
jgi:hypothetical protein